MAWDDSKKTNEAQPGVPDAEKITAGEWNQHVQDQKNRGYNAVSSISSDYSANPQEIVLVDASGGPVTVTLPSPEAAASVVVKKTDSSSNAVTIARPGSESIDGDASDRTITAEDVSREVTSDGTDYFII